MSNRLTLLSGFAISLLLGACAGLTPDRQSPSTSKTTAQQASAALLQAREPGKKPTDGDYWATRLTYPTFHFNSAWLWQAKRQHDANPISKPDGFYPQSLTRGVNDLPTDRFTSLGPQPLGGGQFGAAAGRVNVIVTHPSDDSVAYLASDGGGVWKTTDCCDANTTWQALTEDALFNSIAIGDLHLDPNDADIVYAGTGDLRYGSYSFGSAGLLRSKDAGANWEILGAEEFNPVRPQQPGEFPQYQAIGKVRTDPRDSTKIVVGTKTGLFLSYDDGANWTGPCLTNGFTTQRQDITGLEIIDTGSASEMIVAVGTRGHNTTVQPDLDQSGANGIYRGSIPASGCPTDFALISRADNGWPAGTGGGVGFPTNLLGRIDIAVAPSDSDVIYAEVASPSTRGLHGVWRSTDGGVSWQQRSDVNGLTGCFGDWPQNWYDQGVTIHPTDPDILFMSTVDLQRSNNGGSTFTNVTCGYAGGAQVGEDVHVDHHARAFVGNDPARLLIGNDGGVYYASNADAANARQINFINLNTTLNTIEFYGGDITANFATSTERAASGGAQDNGSSIAQWNGAVGPTAWTGTLGGDGVYARIEPILGQRWYQESQNGNLRVSTNGPLGPYTSAAGDWGGDRLNFLFPYEIYKTTCPATGCEHLIAGSMRVWETLQGGIPSSSWYANSPDLSKGVLGDRSFINQLSFAVSDETIVIAGTNDGNVQYGFNLGQGAANTATWVDVSDSNNVLPNRPILDVATDPNIPTLGYAAVGGFNENTPATPGHVYRVNCTTGCASFNWEDKSGNLPNIPVNSIMVNPNNPAQVFAGTDWGLYFTDNIEAISPQWVRFNEGLPSVMIWDMSIDHGATTLAVFTRSRGAFVWPLPRGAETILVDSFEALP